MAVVVVVCSNCSSSICNSSCTSSCSSGCYIVVVVEIVVAVVQLAVVLVHTGATSFHGRGGTVMPRMQVVTHWAGGWINNATNLKDFAVSWYLKIWNAKLVLLLVLNISQHGSVQYSEWCVLVLIRLTQRGDGIWELWIHNSQYEVPYNTLTCANCLLFGVFYSLKYDFDLDDRWHYCKSWFDATHSWMPCHHILTAHLMRNQTN